MALVSMINRQGSVNSNWVNCTLGLINEELNNTLPLAVFAFTPTFVPGIFRSILFGIVLHVTVTSSFSRFNCSGSLACALAAFFHSIIVLSVPLYLSVCLSLSVSLSLSVPLCLSVCPCLCLSLSLSFCLSLYLSVSLSVCPSCPLLAPVVARHHTCCLNSVWLRHDSVTCSNASHFF